MMGSVKKIINLFCLLSAVSILFLSAACAQGGPILQGLSTDETRTDAESGSGQVQATSENTVETTLGPGSTSIPPALPGDQGAGNVDTQSGGGRIEGYGGEPGQIDSSAPGELVEEDQIGSGKWSLYNDESFEFSITYPETYIILPEPADLQEEVPGLIHRVRFQDVNLASSEISNQEIPQFSIEIFDPGELTLQKFSESSAQGTNLEDYSLGDLHGYRESNNKLIAPNEFYYFTDGVFVFKLTPLGPYGQEMLDSFTFQP